MHIDNRIECFLKHFNELLLADRADNNYNLLLINTSLWGRRILEYINDDLNEKIQILDNTSGNPQSEEYISLRELFGIIIHSINLNIYEHKDGFICLKITGDKKASIKTVNFDHLIESMNKLKISDLFRILTICKKLQNIVNSKTDPETEIEWEIEWININMRLNFSWLLGAINENNEVKRKILSEFFKVDNVANSTLLNIKFSSSTTTKPSVIIRRNLVPDITQPNIYSAPFSPQQILNLIRKEIEEQIEQEAKEKEIAALPADGDTQQTAANTSRAEIALVDKPHEK